MAVLTVRRGLRSIIRNPLRSGLMVALLTASVGLSLIMLTVDAALAQRMEDTRDQVGAELTVRPAGAFGGFGGGGGGFAVGGNGSDEEQPSLTNDLMTTIASLPDVLAVTSTLTAQWTTGDLVAGALTPPAGAPEGAPAGRTGFTPPIIITGTDTPDDLIITGGGSAEVTDGRVWTADEWDADVAVIGQALAASNELAVGSTFDVEGTAVTVIGIFSSGQQFGDNAIFMPIASAQRLLGRDGEVSTATVYVSNADETNAVAEAIHATVGEDVVDVVTPDQRTEALAGSLTDAASTSRTGLIAALVVSGAVIVLSVGLAARQRIKELGILKAIGASNTRVVAQFATESLALSVVAALIGALLTYPAAQSVANALVDSPQTQGPLGGGGGPGGAGGGGPTFIQSGPLGGVLGDVTVVVSPSIFLYALGLAVALAILASIVPAWHITRVKPAEVLRYD